MYKYPQIVWFIEKEATKVIKPTLEEAAPERVYALEAELVAEFIAEVINKLEV